MEQNSNGVFSEDRRTLTVIATRKWSTDAGNNPRNFKLTKSKKYIVGFYSSPKNGKQVRTGFTKENYLVICDGFATLGLSTGILLAPYLLF